LQDLAAHLCHDALMTSYAVITATPVATDDDTVLALVVTDGRTTNVYGRSTLAVSLGQDVAWGRGSESEVLARGLGDLRWYTVIGPISFLGDVDAAGKAMAKIYGL
jgi:hypothetical protein